MTSRITLHDVRFADVRLAPVPGVETIGPYVRTRHAPRTPVLPIRLPTIGRCTHQERLTVFVFDESGSVQSRNDPARPIANRREETYVVIDHLGTCNCGKERVAFVYFDTGTYDLAPTPLTKPGSAAIRHALAHPAPFTSSRVELALQKAYRLVEDNPDHDPAIVVYSDFELFDDDPVAVLTRFAAFEGHAHAVVLHSAIPPVLASSESVTVTHVGWDATRGAVAHALLPTLGRGRDLPNERKSRPVRTAEAAPRRIKRRGRRFAPAQPPLSPGGRS